MNDTLEYYNKNASSFIEDTFNTDMSDCCNRFLKYLKPSSEILDLGCGSGRDSLYFKNKGFSVTAIDGSPEICEQASKLIGIRVECKTFKELDYISRFDGIWACASLLHVEKDSMGLVLHKVSDALKEGGYLYASYKYGECQRSVNGRLFSDYSENNLDELFNKDNRLNVIEYWISSDNRPGRENEKWLNVISKKAGV